jgi:hypothetical protein
MEDNDHSSSPVVTDRIKRPTRRPCRRAVCPGLRRPPPYLVLLRAGFCLPPVLPRARCALTAPFHPYPSIRPDARLRSRRSSLRAGPRACRELAVGEAGRESNGGIFSVPLSFELPRPGVTRRTALRSSDFPPSFALGASFLAIRRAGPLSRSGHIARRQGLAVRSARNNPPNAKDGDRLSCCDVSILRRGAPYPGTWTWPPPWHLGTRFLAVALLRNLVLLELLVQVAARSVDHLSGL